jgi:hypothetical protein
VIWLTATAFALETVIAPAVAELDPTVTAAMKANPAVASSLVALRINRPYL